VRVTASDDNSNAHRLESAIASLLATALLVALSQGSVASNTSSLTDTVPQPRSLTQKTRSVIAIFNQRFELSYPPSFKTVFETIYGEDRPNALYVRESVPDGESRSKWSAKITLSSRRGEAADPRNTPSGYVWSIFREYRDACPSSSSSVNLGPQKVDGYEGFALFASCGSTSADGLPAHGETVLILAVAGSADMYWLEWVQRRHNSDHTLEIDAADGLSRLKQLEPILICPGTSGEVAPLRGCAERH
jgi:hypothetical protein